MSKMGSHDHFDIWNTSYGQKKGWESNWQFDSQPLKVGNRANCLECRWHLTYRWKALDKGYNFALDVISIRGLHTKLWGPKVVGVPTLGISGLPFGSPGTNCHLDVGFMKRHRIYYKGEHYYILCLFAKGQTKNLKGLRSKNKKPEGFAKQKQSAIFAMQHASQLVVHHPSLIYNVPLIIATLLRHIQQKKLCDPLSLCPP